MLLRAVKYEWSINQKKSELLAEASSAMWQSAKTTPFGELRRKQMERIGWGQSEAQRVMNTLAGYFLIRQRMEDIARQERSWAVKKS